MATLTYLLSKKYDETYTVNFYNGPQIIENQGHKFVSDEIYGLVDISSFSDETWGDTSNVYFTKYLKYKYGDTWSRMIPLDGIIASGLTFSCSDDEDIIKINPNKSIIIELYYFITHDSDATSILSVDNISIGGEYGLNVFDEIATVGSGDTALLVPEDIYKIFSLDDFLVVADGSAYNISFRFTQDNNRTYTEWLPLTIDELTHVKLNPLRFAKVEYLIENTSTSLLTVYDIVLDGDFQNVSANYLKTNKYGLKQDCITAAESPHGTIGTAGYSPGVDNTNRDFYSSCSSYSSNTVSNDINTENDDSSAISQYWNPYQHQQITDFANLLGNQVAQIFGWDVDYHLADPDDNGTDVFLHEYTLKNIIEKKRVKIIVPENKFPVESLVINQFNLDLFDTFEIHILKDEFKNKFGITTRPGEDDILYICEANMLYYVKHSQAFKDVMNAATYYKLILEKYEDKTNIRNTLEESQEQINELTNNTTLDEVFGQDMKDAQNQIANKEQLKPTSFDFIRQTISNKVVLESEIVNAGTINVINTVYDLSDLMIVNRTAIDYKKSDIMTTHDNRSFIFWFNFKNSYNEDNRLSKDVFTSYNISNDNHVFLANYENTNGYKIYYKGGKLGFTINNTSYRLNFPNGLLTNIWYAGVVNLNQRQKEIDINVYKRNSDIEVTYFNPLSYQKEIINITGDTSDLISRGFKPVTNIEENKTDLILLSSVTYDISETQEFNIDTTLKILGSNIKYSNLRVFSEIIPDDNITNVLEQNIIKDSQYLILADNANKKVVTTNYYFKNWK